MQPKADKNYNTLRNYNSIQIGSTVLVQGEDGGLWTHRTIGEKRGQNHNDWTYKIYLTKTEMADNKEQQTCEYDTSHIKAIPQGSAWKGQKYGHIRGHDDTVLKPNPVWQ